MVDAAESAYQGAPGDVVAITRVLENVDSGGDCDGGQKHHHKPIANLRLHKSRTQYGEHEVSNLARRTTSDTHRLTRGDTGFRPQCSRWIRPIGSDVTVCARVNYQLAEGLVRE